MALNYRRSQGNPLIRRVQRHMALSTLFRSPVERSLVQDSLRSSGYGGQAAKADLAPGLPVVRASLLTIDQQDELAAANEGSIPPAPAAPIQVSAAQASLQTEPPKARPNFLQRAAAALGLRPAPKPAAPTASAAPGTGLPPERGRMEGPPAAVPAPPVIPTPAASRQVVQAARAPAPAQAQPIAAPPASAPRVAEVPSQTTRPAPTGTNISPAIAPQPTDAALDDSTWRRLQTIYRRHAEQESLTEAGSEVAEPSAPETPAGELEIPRAESPEPPAPDEAAAQAVQRTPQSPAASGPESVGVERKLSRPLIQEQPLAGGSSQTPPAPEPVPSAARLPSIEEVETSDRPIDPDATLVAPPAALQRAPVKGAPAASPEPALPAVAPAAEEAAPSLPADVIAAPEEAEPAAELQSMSLEAAWPVQRLAEESSSAIASAPAEPPLPAPQAELAVSPQAHRVSSLLQQVEPGQPTDSAVEVVTPRRPRPNLPERTPAAVQAFPAPETRPAESAAPGLPPQGTSAEAAQPASPEMVPTEIGPLPADLWQLIGQTPPSAPAPEAGQPVGNPPAHAAPAGAASAPAPVVQLMPQPPERSQPAQAEPVQRQVAKAPVSVIPITTESQDSPPAGVLQMAEAQAPAEASPAQPTEPAPEVDVDELTRRVYQEIKRRLSTEWERMRRKM